VIVGRVIRSVWCVVLVLLACLLAGGVSSALAESSWWHLTAGARPSVLHSGVAQDEVQELSISATKGNVLVADSSRITEVIEELVEVLEGRRALAEVQYAAFLPYNASAQQVQEALQRSVFPSRKVLVSEKPVVENTHTYVITFPGQSVLPLFANGFYPFIFGVEGLSCEGATGSCTEQAEVREVSKGRPDGHVMITAANLGDAATSGQVKLVSRLPAGVTPVNVSSLAGIGVPVTDTLGNDGPVNCSLVPALSCAFAGKLQPYHQIEVDVEVVVQSDAKTGEAVEASVAGGGGARSESVRHALVFGEEPVPFGVEEYDLAPEEEGGAPDTQAGSHPFQLTTTLTLNQVMRADPEKNNLELPQPAQLVKDLSFRLPPGLIGNPTPFPVCTLKDFLKATIQENECPAQTAVGVARIAFTEPIVLGYQVLPVPVFSLEPSTGEPARFGFTVYGLPVFLDTSVRTGGDYGVTATVNNINQTAGFLKSEVTFWGVPADPRHDPERGWGCLLDQIGLTTGHPPCNPTEPHNPPPLLSLPTSCTGPLQTSVQGDSWLEHGNFQTVQGNPMPAQDGCNRLPFRAFVNVAPDGQAGSTPTGLTVDIHVPQDEALNANGLTPSQVKSTTVVLPEGVALNPAAGDGLQACSEAQIALSADVFPSCPEDSKVGTVEVKTPLLPNALTGAAYLATQDSNPFGTLVALYMVFQDPVSGTLVKVAGEVKLDPVTGQLVSIFPNTPQFPFEDLKLHFFGGSRAPLGTPALCGSYTTLASFTPWSGNPPIESSSVMHIVTGPNNTPCSDPLPFAPELTAGSTNIQAGAYTPFTMTMSRGDGNQNLDAIQLRMPPGLLGTLAHVKLCDEADANAGTCGLESLIGETTVSVGLGDTPFSVKGGKVYITEGYKGAPYGLSIVNPAKAGPFDLGHVIVRAKIELDPATAALIVTTDTTGPYAIPRIIDGIPLQIQHVNVTLNQAAGAGFTFNPTNCEPMKIGGSLTSSQGTVSALNVPFQVTNCATLGFKPQFKVSTNGKTSRADGASLNVRLSYPKAAWGSQANVRYVKVDLPKQLPSFLTTLQHACPNTTFAQNPATCPPGSRVGTATASTPILPVPLSGPAYFVSYGGLKFPELVIVLSGYGVTVQIHGETFIEKGVTSSTFKYIPDVPVNNFELKLPQGPNHALAANGNLCTSKLKMPTRFIAQNGLEIRQTTPITPTGCTKHKHHKHHKKHKHRKK
jgi:hypothetical protein